jgi:erythromycin esterase
MTNVALFAALLLPLARPASAGEVPEPVRAWLADAATPVTSLAPDAPRAELEPLRRIVGQARIVALGEATHGSHEFFAFKRRALEFLVAELGFTDFAIENGWEETEAADRWIQGGAGELKDALKVLSPLWQTAEYASILSWMRTWNADPAHTTKIRLHGLDLSNPRDPAREVKAYLERVDEAIAGDFGPLLDKIGGLSAGGRGGTGPTQEGTDLAGLLTIFDELHADWSAATSEAEWARARRCAHVVQQFWIQQRERSGLDQMGFRDRFMADTARWILAQDPARKLVLSAHNGHVSRDGLAIVEGYGRIESIGHALAADASAAPDEDLSMVVIGCALARGGFRAYGSAGLAEFTLEGTPEGSLERELEAAGLVQALIHVDSAPADGPVRAWLDTPRPMTGIGGAYDPKAPLSDSTRLTTLPAEYDALFFVRAATAAKAP